MRGMPLDFSAAVADDPRGARLSVWVVPGASRSEIAGMHGDSLRVRVAAPPEGGRANRTLLTLLGTLFDVKPHLIHGDASRRKTVLLPGMRAGDAVAVMGRHLA
jgi:uncharacterized protein (TIGR00251 family)